MKRALDKSPSNPERAIDSDIRPSGVQQDTGANNRKAKCKKRLQVYKPEYSVRYPVISRSARGIHYAFCTVCESHFSVAASGVWDVGTHVDGARHKQIYANKKKDKSMQASMTNFLVKDRVTEMEHKVVSAELMWVHFLVEHNIPIAVADHFTKMLPKMVPDSDIAKKFKCGKTKSTCLIKMMGGDMSTAIGDGVGDKPFTVCTDGSNDKSDKFYPVLIRYVPDDCASIKTSLLRVPTVDEPSCTGENIFKTVNAQLVAHGLSWKNCLALGIYYWGTRCPILSIDGFIGERSQKSCIAEKGLCELATRAAHLGSGIKVNIFLFLCVYTCLYI